MLIFLTILIGLAGYSYNKVSSNSQEPPQPKKDRGQSGLGVESMVNDSKQERYAIHYPVFHIKEIDEQIKDYVNQELAGFKEDNAKAQAQDEDGPFELNIKYKVVYYTKDTAVLC